MGNVSKRVLGRCEVVCYHPDHDRTMADLTLEEIAKVVRLWRERYIALSLLEEVEQVLIFESKGELTGTSLAHAHAQIYAGNLVFEIARRERELARQCFADTGRYLGQVIAESELAGPRVIAENDRFFACVPWFARYAYEVFIMPKWQVPSLAAVFDKDIGYLAAMISEVCVRYDKLWGMRMPYVMCIHQAPTNAGNCEFFPFHFEFHPPLRDATLVRYLAGPEIGGGNMINESNPDDKAAELRRLSGPLYRRGPVSD